MDDQIEKMLKALKAEGPGRRLDGLEAAVWARIETRDGKLSMPSAWSPAGAAAVFAALLLGVAVGGAEAHGVKSQQPEVSVFSVEARLAPSTLLESL